MMTAGGGVPAPPAADAQGPTFAAYLAELGLEGVVHTFAGYGFKSRRDVRVWKEMSEQTRELLFKWLMNDKLVNAKELVVLHHSLVTAMNPSGLEDTESNSSNM